MAPSLLAADPNVRPKHFRNLFEECIFVFTVMMATASTTFIQGAIIINTEGIGRDLNMTPAQVTWIAAAIGLASGSFMLFFGKTADSFGLKTQLLAGMAFLAMSSLTAAFAPSAMVMNVLCGLLGLGTAAISPPAIGILFATYPEGHRRNRATGALGAGNPVGFVLGSISSGFSAKYSSWRTSFMVVSFFFFIMTILGLWMTPTVPRPSDTDNLAKQFDYLGTALTIVGMAFLTAGLTEGPELGWSSFKVVILLLIGVAGISGFILWENAYKYPLLDPSVWKNKTFSLCVLCVGLGYMSFITNQFWISLYMQNVQKLSPVSIAVRLMPQTIAGIIWSYIGQVLMSKMPGRTIMGIGGLAYLFGATLLYFIQPESSYWSLLFPALCITVVGADFQFIVSNLYVSTQMPNQASLGAGVLQTAMRLSVSLGLSITSAVYGSISETSRGQSEITFPFSRAYLCSIGFAATALLFVPFMEMEKPRRQSRQPSLVPSYVESDSHRPRTAGEYLDDPEDVGNWVRSHRHDTHGESNIIMHKPSDTSLWSAGTVATVGSRDTYFPRWSWEPDWPDDRLNNPQGQKVVCEVCTKCNQERKVVVLDNHMRDGHWQSRRVSRVDSRDEIIPLRQISSLGESFRSGSAMNQGFISVNSSHTAVNSPGSELGGSRQHQAYWPGNLRPLGDPSWNMQATGPRHLDGIGMGVGEGRISTHPVDSLFFYLNRYEQIDGTGDDSSRPRNEGREERAGRDGRSLTPSSSRAVYGGEQGGGQVPGFLSVERGGWGWF